MGSRPKSQAKVALIYATFPRSTETFVRRELRAMLEYGLKPKLYSIWKGNTKWEGNKIERFTLLKLWTLPFWLPYWAFKKPKPFREVLLALWNKPCPSLQNWNETFLGLGFALVEAYDLKEQKLELFHAVWATMPATAAYALSKLLNVPFSMGAHAYDLFRKGGDWLLIQKIHDASMIRTSSNSSANRLLDIGLDREKVKIIKRGLAKWSIRDSYELSRSGKLKLLSVGRIVEKKGYFLLIQILMLLKKRSKCEFEYTIVGSGNLLNQLQITINRVGLSKEVTLVGAKKEDEVQDLFLESDAMLFTGIVASNGDRDGIPNVIPEAMSAGCLILASCYAGSSEAFIDGASGYSLNPKEPEKWVEILEDLAENPKKYQKIRKEAEIYVRKRFDINETAKSLIKNFQKITYLNETKG